MHEIVVLGGYGRVGQLCVAELVKSTRARIVVAGRSIQRAEDVAAAHGGRARAAYVNAEDRRTLQRALPGSALVVFCAGADLLDSLVQAIDACVPFISLTPSTLEPRAAYELQRRAWTAQVPVVLEAGAVPGLPGVLAELLVRSFPALHEIRIACTGPWLGSGAALGSQRVRADTGRGDGWLRRPVRWRFSPRIGSRWLRPSSSGDLAGFVESHCVERLVYLEPESGPLRRLAKRGPRTRDGGFALAAAATVERGTQLLEDLVTLEAVDPLEAAAASLGTLAGRVLRGRMPGGFFVPREALDPLSYLGQLEKRGVRVSTSLPMVPASAAESLA
ncbi:MAG: saccharopine dehydrogenase NADP-binding domain-containing protein [Myxococcota bacterium]